VRTVLREGEGSETPLFLAVFRREIIVDTGIILTLSGIKVLKTGKIAFLTAVLSLRYKQSLAMSYFGNRGGTGR